MKKMIILSMLALLISGFRGYSQAVIVPGSIDKISSMEKSRYIAHTVKHTSGLVNNYDLKYHRFRWLVDPSVASIRGSVTSYYVVTAPLMSTIQFELAEAMSADSAFHHGFKVGISHFGNLVTVSFGEIIPPGTLDSVMVYYHGDPPQNNGFGAFSVGKHNDIPVLWTLSEPYGASDWWPSKNDLTDKIDSIDVYVAAPKAYKVASNGVFMGESPYGSNLNVTHWKHKYLIASYLIAIAVTNYAHYTEQFVGPTSSFPIENYVYPEDSISNRERTTELIPIYGLYSQLFGNYPFAREKYGHAEFGWGGGMEHQTMTFIGDGAFNIDILSHELSHQWFGDMITCGSWHDIWLNEGFATYCAGIMYEHTFPDLYWPIWKRNEIAYTTSKPDGSVYCDDTTNVDRIFDGRLSYSKGALVLHQLRWILGDSVFFAGVKSYAGDPALRYGFTFTDRFKAHMEAASGQDLTDYFDTWIYKQGFPSYSIRISNEDPADIAVTLNQTQSHPSVSFFSLPVPLEFMGAGHDTLIVFNNTAQGQVFHVNLGFTIDSVHVDPDMWLITANNEVSLGENDLPPGKHLSIQPNPVTDRLQVIHNLGSFTSVRILDAAGKSYAADISENRPDRLLLDIGQLPTGTYILSLHWGHQQLQRKFVKLH